MWTLPSSIAASTQSTRQTFLNDRVIPFFDKCEISLHRVLKDRVTEFCGKPDTYKYQVFLALKDIDHFETRAKNPQTIGICERFHKTILDEFYYIAERNHKYYPLETQRHLYNAFDQKLRPTDWQDSSN
jgi:hypothetical protein